jgi:formamidopyrimidine-DNA glycosylase
MPELPEVETTAAGLRPELQGRTITGVHVLWPRTIAAPDLPEFLAQLPDQRVHRIGRRAKFVLIELESGDTLIVHLRMTGRLRVEPHDGAPPPDPHVRVWCELSDGRRLVFADVRKFGRMWLVADQAAVLGALGPEPLGASFTPQELAERLRNRRAPIKSLLLDQKLLAGLGNIYATEALFLAGIHPLRRGAELSAEEINRLYFAIREVLAEAVGQRGTTLRDYRTPYGDEGGYQDQLRVYGHNKSEPCPNCGRPIVRMVIGQRSAHFCPFCQPPADKTE